jgi:hypothetical protein
VQKWPHAKIYFCKAIALFLTLSEREETIFATQRIKFIFAWSHFCKAPNRFFIYFASHFVEQNVMQNFVNAR